MQVVKLKKRYDTTKNVNLIHDKIVSDFPELKGKAIPEGFENPLLKIFGDGTFIEITVPDSFDIRNIDNIIVNYNPVPVVRKTKAELIDEFVDDKLATDERKKQLLKMILGESQNETK